MKTYILLAFICLSIFACKETESKGYSIKILNISEEKIDQTLYLIKIKDRKKVIIDSGVVKTNSFEFKGHIEHAGNHYLKFKKNNDALNITLTNEDIRVILDNQNISQSAIAGSSVYSLSNDYIKATSKFNATFNNLSLLAEQYKTEANTAKLDSLKVVYDNVNREKIEFDKTFIQNNPSNVFVTSLLGNLIFNKEISNTEGQTLFNNLQGEAKTSEAALEINGFLKK